MKPLPFEQSGADPRALLFYSSLWRCFIKFLSPFNLIHKHNWQIIALSRGESLDYRGELFPVNVGRHARNHPTFTDGFLCSSENKKFTKNFIEFLSLRRYFENKPLVCIYRNEVSVAD